jgi:hypothetical protein
VQVFVQNRVMSRVLEKGAPISPPWILRLSQKWTWLQRIPALMFGLGFRPEHVHTPDAFKNN